MAFHWVKFYVKHYTYKFHFIHVANIFLQGQKEICASWYFSSFLNFAAHVANLSANPLVPSPHNKPRTPKPALHTLQWWLRAASGSVLWGPGGPAVTGEGRVALFNLSNKSLCFPHPSQNALSECINFFPCLPRATASAPKSFIFLKWRWLCKLLLTSEALLFPLLLKFLEIR